MNNFKNNLKTGFSLTEIIIVVFVFILILVTIFSVYSSGQKGFVQGENIAELTQNSRVILERTVREIRQAGEIITDLSEDGTASSSEIEFRDAHVPTAYATGTPQAVGTSTVRLSSLASDVTDYYKDSFLEIIAGQGQGEIRKIAGYNGTTKTVSIEKAWNVGPNTTSSVYKIDSSYYYIRYYLSSDSFMREVISYCFSTDSVTCVEPYYIPQNSTSTLYSLITKQMEEPREIGEYVSGLGFWGSRVIYISLVLEKNNKVLNVNTSVFGRNL